MTKILLLCAAGMSTSMVVKKMREAAKDRGIDVLIEAHSVDRFDDYLDEYDVFLIGPQIRFRHKELSEVAQSKNKRVEIINTVDYGLMKGAKILDHALSLI